MDIEGAELEVVPEILGTKIQICQLLLEVHQLLGLDFFFLLRTINDFGFFLFSREANSFCCPACFEYSFLHRNCAAEFGLKNLIQENFNF